MMIIREKNLAYTAIDKRQYINAALLYIEQHLSDTLNPETIAWRHFISRSQLYRDFYTCTGHSVKEYIRKRRISNACEKIKCSDMSLSIIADESGCQTQQAFNKLFKSIVGMTPLAYRQSDTYFYFYPYSTNEISLVVKVGRETIPSCATIQFYDSCLIGIENKALASLDAITGRVFGRNGKQIGSQLCYEVMTEQKGVGKTDLYATCVVNYNEPEITAGWDYLYNIWLFASMFEESGDGYFEEYIIKNCKPHKLKLYLPVKKRKTQQHITITSVPHMTFVIAQEQGDNAEHKASKKVMTFLQEHHPLLIKTAQKFYVCAYDDICKCGIACGDSFKLPKDSGVKLLSIPAGQYAVLSDNRLSDMRMSSTKIELWLQNNSISHERQPIFAVYETLNGKYENENIHMNIYKCLKVDTNG